MTQPLALEFMVVVSCTRRSVGVGALDRLGEPNTNPDVETCHGPKHSLESVQFEGTGLWSSTATMSFSIRTGAGPVTHAHTPGPLLSRNSSLASEVRAPA